MLPILEKIKNLIPERELEYYKALLTAKDDEQKKKIIIAYTEKSGIELVPGELEKNIKNATPENILRQMVNIAFQNATDPPMIIYLGDKLGMNFTQEKAEEIAERHKFFKVGKASELTEEEMARSYYNSGAWKDMIPRDKEKLQEPHLMTEEQKRMYSLLLKAKSKEEIKQAAKDLYKSYGVELLPEELEVIENWEPDDINE